MLLTHCCHLSADKRALVDFTYKFGPLQKKIYMASAIPLMVSAVIYNTDPVVPFYPGHANFRLSLWLHTEEDITSGELIAFLRSSYFSPLLHVVHRLIVLCQSLPTSLTSIVNTFKSTLAKTSSPLAHPIFPRQPPP